MTAQTCSRLDSPRQGSALFALSWMAYAAAYVGRYNYSAVMGAITQEGVLSLTAAGAVSTGYFVFYAGGQVLGGALSQCVSPYRMILAGLVCSAGCNLGMALAPAGLMALLWAANGLFQAMIWPPIVRLFAESMPLPQQKRACVSINSTTPAGTLAAYALSAAVLSFASWRSVFLSCGGLLLGAAAVWWLGTAPLCRATRTLYSPPRAEGGRSFASPALGAVLAAGLCGLVIPTMLHGGLKDGVTSWVPSMIQANFGTSPAFSAAVSMALPLINLAGAYLASGLNQLVFHNEMRTSAALFGLAAVSLLVLPQAVGSSLVLALLLLALTTLSMLGINTMLISVMPVRAGRNGGAAMLSGLLNAVTYLGAAAATWGIGGAADAFGWGAVFALWLVMALAGLLLSLALSGRWGRFADRCDPQRSHETEERNR